MSRYNGAILLAGRPLPNPNYKNYKVTIATLVNDARNVDGVLIGQRIGRDQVKLEIDWDHLTQEEWSAILNIFDKNFVNDVTYFDPVIGRTRTRRMYVGDRSGTPFNPDQLYNPRHWISCKANLIDTGEGD